MHFKGQGTKMWDSTAVSPPSVKLTVTGYISRQAVILVGDTLVMPISHVSLIGKPTAGTDLMGTGEELGYTTKIMVKNQGDTGDMYPSLGKITNTQVQKPSLRSNK